MVVRTDPVAYLALLFLKTPKSLERVKRTTDNWYNENPRFWPPWFGLIRFRNRRKESSTQGNTSNGYLQNLGTVE